MTSPSKLLLATKNPKKLAELKVLLESLRISLADLTEFPDAPSVVEDGETFSENALKKARALADWSGLLTLADDSGLSVERLGGRPGVHSARFAGPSQNDRENCLKLLSLLNGVPLKERKAKFHCVLAVARPRETVGIFEGECEGIIGFEMKGGSGFGYDPLFVDPGTGRTFAELSPEEKNRRSHRAKAIEKAKLFLEPYLRNHEKVYE